MSKKISALASGNPAQSADLIPIDRAGANFSLTAGSISALSNLSIAGSASPTPAYAAEAPADQNPSLYVQDENGNWHQQAGVDVTNGGTVNGPPSPKGTLTWYRRMFFRDSQATTQQFKNAAISISHEAGVGTVGTNQDRALAVQMYNPTGNIVSVQVVSNVVRFGTAPSIGTTADSFKVGHVIVPTGLTTATYLNNQVLTIQSITIVNSSSMLIFVAFTHADVSSAADTGVLNLQMYSMACLQMEMDVYGTPSFLNEIDSEVSTLSLQMADNHVGGISISSLGCHCLRMSYFREPNAGNWNAAGGINIGIVNDSSVDLAFSVLHGIVVTAGDFAAAPNGIYAAIDINAPSPRFSAGNFGLFIRNFGTNAADKAIRVDGGFCNFGPDMTTVANLTVSGIPSADPHIVGQLFKNAGTGAVFVSAG